MTWTAFSFNFEISSAFFSTVLGDVKMAIFSKPALLLARTSCSVMNFPMTPVAPMIKMFLVVDMVAYAVSWQIKAFESKVRSLIYC